MDVKRIKDFPYEVKLLDPQENEEITEYIRGYKEEFVRIGPKKYFFRKGFMSVAAAIYNFPLRSDDTFVVTHPKSGTTLTQELVWLICNNLDYEKAESNILTERFPFLEVTALIPADKLHINTDQKDVMKNRLLTKTIEDIIEMPSPRFIKSHMPLSLLPPSLLDNAKVVYMARDPRDVVVSYFHHHKLMKMMTPDKDFKPFWNYFVSDNMFYAPYFEHVLEAWEKRNHPNMLFLKYEEVVKDLAAAVRLVATFFNKTLSDEQVNKLAEHLDIKNFKKNKSVNMEMLQESRVFRSDGGFIRKGQPGDWRTYFDEEMTAQAEEWIAKNLRGTDFRLSNHDNTS